MEADDTVTIQISPNFQGNCTLRGMYVAQHIYAQTLHEYRALIIQVPAAIAAAVFAFAQASAQGDDNSPLTHVSIKDPRENARALANIFTCWDTNCGTPIPNIYIPTDDRIYEYVAALAKTVNAEELFATDGVTPGGEWTKPTKPTISLEIYLQAPDEEGVLFQLRGESYLSIEYARYVYYNTLKKRFDELSEDRVIEYIRQLQDNNKLLIQTLGNMHAAKEQLGDLEADVPEVSPPKTEEHHEEAIINDVEDTTAENHEHQLFQILQNAYREKNGTEGNHNIEDMIMLLSVHFTGLDNMIAFLMEISRRLGILKTHEDEKFWYEHLHAAIISIMGSRVEKDHFESEKAQLYATIDMLTQKLKYADETVSQLFKAQAQENLADLKWIAEFDRYKVKEVKDTMKELIQSLQGLQVPLHNASEYPPEYYEYMTQSQQV